MNVEQSKKMRELYSRVPGFPGEDPIDLPALAGDGGPIELEIGFGRGRFLLERAVGNPSSRFVGIETRRKWVHRAAERAANLKLTNIVVRRGDARAAIARMEPEASLSRAVINFPDPWWKARHEKRMVVGEALLDQLARLLVDGGEIFVQTDVDFRAEIYREALAACDALEPARGDGWLQENPLGARSSREARCEELEMPIYRLLFRRRTRSVQ